MPNYCDNKLVITGAESAVDSFNRNAVRRKDGPISLEALSPYPKRVIERLYATAHDGQELTTKHRLRPQWRTANWGTIREVRNGYTAVDIPGYAQYIFRTAWKPVNSAFLRKITRDFPGIRVKLSYADPFTCFSGHTVAPDGWITEESREPYDPMAKAETDQVDDGASRLGPKADLWLLTQQGMVDTRLLRNASPDRRTPLNWIHRCTSYTLYQDPASPQEHLILMDPEPSGQAPHRALSDLARLAGIDIADPAPEDVWRDERDRQFSRLTRHVEACPGSNSATERAAAMAASHAADLERLLRRQAAQTGRKFPQEEKHRQAEEQALHQVRQALSLLEQAVDILHHAPKRS